MTVCGSLVKNTTAVMQVDSSSTKIGMPSSSSTSGITDITQPIVASPRLGGQSNLPVR